MLSDFDLAKQSNGSGGMPTMVQSEHNGASSVFFFFKMMKLASNLWI